MSKIHDFTAAVSALLTDLFIVDRQENSEWVNKKVTLQQIADAIFGAKTDNNLPHYTGTPTAGSTAEAIGAISVIKKL